MRLWHFSSSVNSFFKSHAQPSIGTRSLLFGLTLLYFHTSCVRTAKALARLHSPEPSLVAYVISTIISCAGLIISSIFLEYKGVRMNIPLIFCRLQLKLNYRNQISPQWVEFSMSGLLIRDGSRIFG